MAQETIAVIVRSGTGGTEPRRLRRNGLLPGILYGGKEESIPLTLDMEVIKQTCGMLYENQIVNLELDREGKKIRRPAMVKEIQIDHLKRIFLHIDFQQISLDEKLSATVPILAVGEAIGVTRDGGILEHILREVEIECLPVDIPEAIKVDVSELNVGESLRIKDIPPIAGVEILTEPELGILTVAATLTEEEAEAMDLKEAESAEAEAEEDSETPADDDESKKD